ncbi:MAG TPA: Ig-like domain-containing protein [Mycobacteriales bacterium]|nr:Ig-like domain-containing protein [Mycobacteriales bacterium]
MSTPVVAASGGSATVTGNYTGTSTGSGSPVTSNIEYTVTNGGDKSGSSGTAGTPCTVTPSSATAGTFSCSVANTSGNPTTDTVQVFGDDGSGAFNTPGDVVGAPVANVVFTGPPTTVAFTTAPTSGTTGTCAVYQAHTDQGDQPLTLTVTETTTAAAPANSLHYFQDNCSGAETSGGGASAAGGTTTLTKTVTTDASGNVSFGLQTDAAGTGNAKLAVPSNPGTINATTPTITWTTGGADAVTSVTPNPPSTTQLTNTTASFTVTVTNGGSPVQGVTVKEETNPSASPANADTVAPTSCGTSDSAGHVTCTVHNGGTAGTDSLIFWVDNSSASCSHTAGPDSCEPQGNATATFNATPAVDAGNSSLTCVQQLATDKGAAKTNCTVPSNTTSVTFTATVEDASGNPIANAPVTFTATSAKLGGATVSGANLPSGTSSTNANGVATFVVSDPSAQNGDNVTVSAAVGAVGIGSATVNWATPHATALSVVPELQTVTVGGVVTVKANPVDQFGTAVAGSPTITYFVTGRNNAKTGTAAADGTISYTDAGTSPTVKTDTIQVTDSTDSLTGTADVVYVTGSTSASTVTVDTSGSGTSDVLCGATGHVAATNVALQHTTEVCALVKNATGEALAGKTVTFTVSSGQVAAHSGLTTSSGTTYQATTDANGVAFADVTSTKAGAQTVTATADSASGTGTVTYAGPTPAQAFKITAAPSPATINPGSSQKFTATVVDKFGNPVPNVIVVYTQSGAGSLGNSGGQTITGPDGTASVTVDTQSSDTGAGSVTFNIGSSLTVPPNQCTSTGGACTAVASYTVQSTGAAFLTLTAEKGAKIHTHETIHAVATNADGTPAAHVIVRFIVQGANPLTGSMTTGAKGRAGWSYLAGHHGTDTVSAWVDNNNDNLPQANEPGARVIAHIKGIERPSITVVARGHGKVTVHVVSRPLAKHATVHYFVKRHGHWHKIGTNHTGRLGKAGKTFREPIGSHRIFRAKVMTTPVSTTGTSAPKGVRVR